MVGGIDVEVKFRMNEVKKKVWDDYKEYLDVDHLKGM